MTDTDRRWNVSLLVAAALVALGLALAGWFVGGALSRARLADRSVTVRGLAERDVVADLATWTVVTSATGGELGGVQAKALADRAAVLAFLKGHGFTDDELETGGVSLNQHTDNGRPVVTIRQRIILRTLKVMQARKAFAEQALLLGQGVALEGDSGGGIAYSFTKLNEIKPPMIAAATRNARAGAEQFAKDSGAAVGAIKSAQQGLFSIKPRDGGDDEYSNANGSPFQKVRVVTTIDFYLE